MGRASIKCGTATTIYDRDIDNSTSMTLANTASTGIITFKTGSTDGDTALMVKNSGGTIAAAFHGNGQCLFNGPLFSKMEHESISGALPSNTYSAAQLLKGVLSRGADGAPKTDKMPSAADVIDLISNAQEGSAFWCTFRNTGTNDDITLANADDASNTFELMDSNKVIQNNKSQTWLMIVISIAPSPKKIRGYLVGASSLT